MTDISLPKGVSKSIVTDAQELVDEQEKIISISPAVDVILSGGVPQGCLLVLSGAAGAGKTSTAIQLAANAQQHDMDTFYLDVEGRLKKLNLQGIHNLDISRVKHIRSTEQQLLTAEQYLTIAENIIKESPHSIIIIDSLSSLCSASEQVDEISGSRRSLGPKIIASFCRRVGTLIGIQKSIVVCTNHLIANTSPYGAPYQEDSGNKIRFQADIRMRAKKFEKWMDGNSNIGQIIHWECRKSALGAWGMQTTSYLRYGYGLDRLAELMQLGLDLGIIEKGGAWIKFNGTNYKGYSSFINNLEENEELVQTLQDGINKCLGI